MKPLLSIILFLLFPQFESNRTVLPDWFMQSFNYKKLNVRYKIITTNAPFFLSADFNGDKKNDIAVKVLDIKTQKTGILILNQGCLDYYVFGAGKKFLNEEFDNIKWISGWKLIKKKYVYKPTFKSNGDILGSEKVNLKYPAIYIYRLEDGDDIAGEIIFWKNNTYTSIHQGE